jgi:tRNA threonylcarbamoyladenosine biosynthesis protein TsaB
MVVLGLDTATRATAVALRAADGREHERRDDPPAGARPGHTTQALPLIVATLSDSAIGWDGVTRIAVGVGPGTFTGLRIGIATARALARARSIPIVGVSTLQSLALIAAGSGENDDGLVAAVIDARRGELFAAAWERDAVATPGARPVLEPFPFAPEALGEAMLGLGRPILAVGDGAVRFRQLLEDAGAIVPDDAALEHRVSAVGHCRLGAAIKVHSGRRAEPVVPAYLRVPDAELTRRRAAHR